MYWGPGSALGMLALIGYAVSVCGAVMLWAHRIEVPIWVHDEVGAVRRTVVRHAVSGLGRGLREQPSCKACPTCFMRRLGRPSRRKINRVPLLLPIGPRLF